MSGKQEYWKQYYDKNQKKISARRKIKYHADPKYRNAILKRQRKYRRDNPSEGPVRFGVPVSRIGEVAAEAGVSPRVMRKWEEDGYLPTHTMGGTHRVYTEAQEQYIYLLAEFMEENPWWTLKDKKVKKALDRLVGRIKKGWES